VFAQLLEYEALKTQVQPPWKYLMIKIIFKKSSHTVAPRRYFNRYHGLWPEKPHCGCAFIPEFMAKAFFTGSLCQWIVLIFQSRKSADRRTSIAGT